MLSDLFEETWKELKCGSSEKGHPFRVCSLATSHPNEPVRQRIVILREITPRQTLLFYTDSRSSKMDHLRQNETASCLFYNPSINFQVFVRGKMNIHTNDEIWEEHRLRIDGRSVNDYNTKFNPGKKIKNPVAVSRTNDLNFAVLEMIPEKIEYLKLKTEPNRLRATFTKFEEDWEMTFLIP